MPMNFADGSAGLTMRPEFKGSSAIDLIEQGSRTATTRNSISQFKKPNGELLEVGDVIEVFDSTGKRLLVEVTKAPYQLPRPSGPEQLAAYSNRWSQLEGWAPEGYNNYIGKWQIQYKLVGNTAPPAQAVAQEGFTLGRPVSSETWEASTAAPSSQKIFKSNASGSPNKPLSALTMKLRDGRTIEEAYQLDIKGYRSAAEQNPRWSGPNRYKMWMQGKRQPTLNGQTREQLEAEYKELWRNWFAENPDQFELAKRAIGNMTINDTKASPGSVSQSKVIRELLNEL
jgi:hypothetical protein